MLFAPVVLCAWRACFQVARNAKKFFNKADADEGAGKPSKRAKVPKQDNAENAAPKKKAKRGNPKGKP